MRRNYKILHSDANYCLIGDLSSDDKYHFYYKYKNKDCNNRKRRINKRVVYIIIGFVLIFFTIFFKLFIPEFHDNLYDEYFEPYSETNVTRSETQNNKLIVAFKYIQNQEYDIAYNILSTYDKKDMSTHFYLGQLYQRKGDYNKAILEYNTIINNNDNLFVEQSHWYIGLCYLKNNDIDNYIQHFKILAEKNDGFYKLKSQIILNKTK